jgi:prolyl oligopeptidase
MTIVRNTVLAATLACALAPSTAWTDRDKPAAPQKAARRPVVDTYHGVKVIDDYRWLEDSASPEVKAWVSAFRDYSRARLEALPGTGPLTERLLGIDDARPVQIWPYRVGQVWYASKVLPGKTFAVFARLAGPEDSASAKVLFDPSAADPKGFTAPDFWVPSYDGKKLAVSLSRKGSEDGALTVLDLETGAWLRDELPRVHGGTAGGAVQWLPDSSGLYYTRYPRKGERPDADLAFYQQVWLHKLGTPIDKDTYVAGKEFPKIAETSFVASIDGKRLLIAVRNGDGGDVSFWARGAGGAFTQLARDDDRVISGSFGVDGALYLLSLKDAPRGRVLRLPPDVNDLARAKVVVPEGTGRIERVLATRGRLYVASLVGGPSELRSYDLEGRNEMLVPTPPVSSVGLIQRIDPGSDEILFSVTSYLEPRMVYRWAPGGALRRSPLSTTSPVDFSDYEVERVSATSKDGTQVPLTLIHRKGMARNGKTPTLLTGYGGYGISMTPFFNPTLIAWLEQDAVYAIASLRGGAEFGEQWHEQGKLTNKQHVFDDFVACAQWLIDSKVTSPARLAIEGGSNGGLLMGAALTQRPDLFAAVVSHVGIYDMLRVELSPNGEFNVTEFGTVKDPAQFQALYAYSPYHRVRDGVKYPPLLLMTGDNDPRVEPMQSRKFAARLLAAGAKDVLLFTNADAGHSVPERTQRFRQAAYAYAFLMDRLGMKPKSVAANQKSVSPTVDR